MIGSGRHGKDTACELLLKRGFTFESSSYALCEELLFPLLKDKYGYATPEDCYADRHREEPENGINLRQEWYEAIKAYNDPDLTALGRLIYSKYNIYCGIRNIEEFTALRDKRVFDYSIWVDRSDHLPPESETSMTVRMRDADYVLDNNGTLEQLEANLDDLIDFLTYQHNL